ncbi:hypothetical protein QYE76_021544 [Lolium multiflorum]|uniref:Uncharacterized protein n=1 Tax=Lolium multiflorum TaxID=4521 RepID=A0AAD8R7W6_LOLMU|nr:hypothetical protein QYE76_021544 [Lolium multiflorum]
MVKKKIPSAAASSTSVGAAARSSSVLAKEVAPNAPPPAPAPPAPPSSTAKPGDWTASTVTKRDEKRSRSLGLISSDEGNVIFPASKDSHNLPNDTSEGRGSSEPVDFRTVEHTSPFDEPDDPINSETAHANFPPSAGDTCDTEGSVRNDDADHNAFVDAAVEETRASPKKRSIGGFADEDDLLDFDDTFIEPPPKKARSDAVSPAAASEASAQSGSCGASIDCLLSFQRERCSCCCCSSFSCVISSLEAFASQFTSLEADKIRLQEEARSSSSKLDGAIKKAAVARQEVDSLKEELNKLKERLKEEEARAAEKDELLRQSALALLEAADIPATALDKVPSNSPANGVSTVLAAHQLTRGLLDKGKGALARMHSMILPKATQEKTLGQLIDAFAIDTKEVIEVFPVPSFVDDSSGIVPENDRIQRMKDRIAQMEKDLRSTYALAAIINKKSETAADVERYALTELHKATESLNCLLSIANVTGELEALYPKVLLPANIIVDRLERDSKVPEEKETPQV